MQKSKSANTGRSGRARQRSAVRSHPLQRPLLRYPECGSDSGRAGWGEASQRSQRRVWSLGVSWRNDFPFSPGANCTMTTSHLPSRCLFSEKKKGVSDRAVFGIIARSKPRISRSVAQPFQWFHAPLSFENFAPAMRCQLRWLAFPPVFLAMK